LGEQPGGERREDKEKAVAAIEERNRQQEWGPCTVGNTDPLIASCPPCRSHVSVLQPHLRAVETLQQGSLGAAVEKPATVQHSLSGPPLLKDWYWVSESGHVRWGLAKSSPQSLQHTHIASLASKAAGVSLALKAESPLPRPSEGFQTHIAAHLTKNVPI